MADEVEELYNSLTQEETRQAYREWALKWQHYNEAAGGEIHFVPVPLTNDKILEIIRKLENIGNATTETMHQLHITVDGHDLLYLCKGPDIIEWKKWYNPDRPLDPELMEHLHTCIRYQIPDFTPMIPELGEIFRRDKELQEGTALAIRTLPRKDIAIPEFIQTVSTKIYHSMRDIIAQGALTTENGENWPTGYIECPDIKAEVQIRPDPATVDYLAADDLLSWQKKAADYALSVSDETADVLDYITWEVISQASGPEQDVVFSAERFYQLRGIKKQLGGEGRRGGYKTEYRRDFAREVERLQETWVLVAEIEQWANNEKGKRRKAKQRGIESRVIVISKREGQLNINKRVEPDTFGGRLGDLFANAIFGDSREYALMSVKALGYDPYRQIPEKRLTRYLSWQWRIRQKSGNYLQPFTVEKLLTAAGLDIDKRNPDRTKNRLEKALDTLESDKGISGWQYGDGWDEEKVGKRGWCEVWKSWNVCIEPPKHIPEYYKEKIPAIDQKKQKALPAPNIILLRLQAALANLTQMQAAENIGINQATLSRIVSGKNPSPANRKKILAWLDKQESIQP